MTSQELYRRAKAVKLADSINKIEGAPVSPAAKLLAARWAKGEMTEAKYQKIYTKKSIIAFAKEILGFILT